MLNLIGKVIKGLNSDDNPWSIAVAIGLGMIVGLTPFWSVHNLLVLFIAFIFRIHLGSFWLSVAVFSIISAALMPLFNQIGNALLANPDLYELWTSLYQSEIWRLSRFNNSDVLGGIIFSVVSLLPMILLSYFIVIRYRTKLKDRLQSVKWIQWLRASKAVTLFMRLQERS